MSFQHKYNTVLARGQKHIDCMAWMTCTTSTDSANQKNKVWHVCVCNVVDVAVACQAGVQA